MAPNTAYHQIKGIAPVKYPHQAPGNPYRPSHAHEMNLHNLFVRTIDFHSLENYSPFILQSHLINGRANIVVCVELTKKQRPTSPPLEGIEQRIFLYKTIIKLYYVVFVI